MKILSDTNDPRVRAVDFLFAEACKCGLTITKTVRVEGAEYTVYVQSIRTLRKEIIVGTVNEVIAAFDTLAVR